MNISELNSKIQSSAKTFTEELAKSDHEFAPIAQKVLDGKRISYEDGCILIKSNDLMLLGQMANFFRQRKNYEVAIKKGFDEKTALERVDTVWWNTNTHLNPTNVCIGTCDFCAFAKQPNEEGAYTMTIPEAVDRAHIARSEGATEVHIVGGLNPKTIIEYYSELIRAIKKEVPGIHVKGFTAVEIEFFMKFAKVEYEKANGAGTYDKMSEDEKIGWVFDQLITAGLDSMPGGGAEVFSRQVRDEMCPDKIPADLWIKIHQIAHSKGIMTNATMLAGIGEDPEERVEHLDTLRKAQDSTIDSVSIDALSTPDKIFSVEPKRGRWQTFIPLSCHYEGNDLLERGVKPLTAVDELKNIAVARLMLDNFDNIKAYWIQIGPKLAQVALSFGANDLDGTVKAERITNAAGAQIKGLAEQTLIDIIEGARLKPQERDSVYNPIELSEHKVASA